MVKADVVICGAGIAGVSAAYFLTVRHGVRDVVLVDERAPLTLTSDKSTEAYRNWWPGPGTAMVGLMDRSIDLLDDLAQETGNRFHMNRRGYVYLSANPARVSEMKREAIEVSRLGAGPLRIDQHYSPIADNGFTGQPGGADLVLDPALITASFPFINSDAVVMLHARRCGWLSAQQLGMVLLEKAREAGARFIDGRVTGVNHNGNSIESVVVQSGQDVHKIQTGKYC